MTLEKISLSELFLLQNKQFEEYHNVLKHLVPKPIKAKKEIESLTDLTFGEVTLIKMNLKEPSLNSMVEIFKTIFGLSQKDIFKISVIDFYHALNWIKEEIQTIYNRELDNLSSSPDPKLKEAGIDALNVFGEMNTLIMLGEKFGQPPQDIENWSYNLVFSLMLHQKITADVNKNLIEINKVKNDD